ncbi:glycogen synthase GlgA [Paraburkholderia sp.]|uniref:glycogen synthase GlgA n=1 Tax=Paraburkholderia sp. TaxID=1926495 RepID=UPI0023A35D0E|nr:glycogen synthase GlgA [Paraburkholderia sp.]MDE1182423.1 glycogen synthase GlgA [Paraburkholderia sp.]
MPLNILMVASEAVPLAKSGGLGDMVSAYSAALRDSGVETSILMPAYPAALEQIGGGTPVARLSGLPGGDGVLIRAHMPDTGVPVLLLRMDHLFARDGLYRDENGRDYIDNLVRFASLAAAAARIAQGVRGIKRPDVVHAHDWHAGLTPLFMKLAGVKARSVFTIHNLAFQGNYPRAMGGWIGVPPELLVPAPLDDRSIEFYDTLSLMKAGIVHADRVTTVSERYAREILTERFGHRMEGVLHSVASRLSGITNGINTAAWNPATDPLIARSYSVENVAGKHACKRELQRAFGLAREPFAPLVAIGSRLTEQKMADVVADAIPHLLSRDSRVQFAILGQGEAHLEQQMRALAAQWPGRVGVKIGYDETAAHGLHAGADMLLHASRFEPCGLTQLYAMRYGTVPVASRVGGLADTISDYSLDLGRSGAATGFLFERETVDGVIGAMERSLAAFGNPSLWHALQRNAMQRDSSWAVPVARYTKLYTSLTDARPATTRRRKVDAPDTPTFVDERAAMAAG